MTEKVGRSGRRSDSCIGSRGRCAPRGMGTAEWRSFHRVDPVGEWSCRGSCASALWPWRRCRKWTRWLPSAEVKVRVNIEGYVDRFEGKAVTDCVFDRNPRARSIRVSIIVGIARSIDDLDNLKTESSVLCWQGSQITAYSSPFEQEAYVGRRVPNDTEPLSPRNIGSTNVGKSNAYCLTTTGGRSDRQRETR